MAIGTTLSTFDAMMKEHYPQWKVNNLSLKNRPALAMLPKYEKFGGREAPIPVLFGDTQGINASFAQAQLSASQTSTSQIQFLLKRIQYYGLSQISGEVIRASKEEPDAWMPVLKTQIDSLINGVSNAHAAYLFGDGSGVLGQMANTTVSTSVITLADPNTVVNFTVGMELSLASTTTANTRAVGSASHGLYVSAINRQAGTLTIGLLPVALPLTSAVNINDSTNGLVSPGTTDYIFRRGDAYGDSALGGQGGGQGVSKVIQGFQSWLPQTVSTSDSYFGANRSSDTRLSGQFLDVSTAGAPIEEALISMDAIIFREGGKADTVFVHPSTYSNLVKSLGSKRQYVDLKDSEVGISFRGVEIDGQSGVLKVVPDPFCPSNLAFVLGLDDDAWQIMSNGPLVGPLNSEDGLDMLRLTSQDGIEVRMGGYANTACRAPGWNGIIKLA